MAHEVSIVTAFFDIGRSDWRGKVAGRNIPGWQARSTEIYLERFNRLARLQNQMVIFTEPRFAETILNIRHRYGMESMTTIMVCDNLLGENGTLADRFKSIKQVMGPGLHKFVHNPGYPEYWNANYVLLTALKPVFVCTALNLGLNAHRQVAWIDFGYCRDDKRLDPHVPWRFDCGSQMNMFYVNQPDDRPVFEIVRDGTQYFQGCHLVGPAECWFPFRDLMSEAMTSLLACGLVHHEEPRLLMAYRRAPEQFRIHAVDRSDWFVVFRAFGQQARDASPADRSVALQAR